MRTMLTLFDEYCRIKVNNCRGYEVLDLNRTYWSDIKSKGTVSSKTLRAICKEIQCPITEDPKELCVAILDKVFV